MPAVPSGLYFAEGLVIISTACILPAGICSKICARLSSVSPAGLPLIHISTLELLRNEILPSLSTSTEGIFSSTSVADAPAAATLASTLNTFLSISKRICEACPITSTS
ncbi:MAG: hypothetical protein BWX65_00917 [Bacteroidetes bacterium ADurb.Bin057]|nr:MAG: hypothetical protein BWX65_00917 [Bacteroidetes bacterium ADurb.Bin057]